MIFFKKIWDDMYNFNVEDLKTNAFGSMSEKQRHGYRFAIYRYIPIGLLLAFTFSLVFFAYIFNNLDPHRISLTIDLVFLVVTGGFLCAMYGYIIIFWGRLRSDFEHNIVLSVSGSASVKKSLLTIDNVTFRTNLATWFQEGKNYRIYYLPKSKVILSVEELP